MARKAGFHSHGPEQATELEKRSPDSVRRKYAPPPIMCASNGQTMQHISQERSSGYSFTMNKRKRTVHCCHPQYVAQARDGWQSKAGSGKRGDLGGPQHLVDICQTLRINKHFRVMLQLFKLIYARASGRKTVYLPRCRQVDAKRTIQPSGSPSIVSSVFGIKLESPGHRPFRKTDPSI
jgi:hypothetical protein